MYEYGKQQQQKKGIAGYYNYSVVYFHFFLRGAVFISNFQLGEFDPPVGFFSVK